MKKIACQYTIVRFAPFVETGEFANVGIIMMAPKQRYFGFRLETKRYARITHFFNELDHKVYRAAMYNLKNELERAADILKQHGFDKRLKTNDIQFAHGLFNEIIKPRETIVRFGNARTILTDDPDKTLKELFGYYVERNFVTKEYKETVLEKGIRKLLYTANVGDRFLRAMVGNDEYHAGFPFVEQKNEQPVKIIKPLYLGQDEPSKILDHGGAWLFRITQLKKRNLLPKKVLFTIEGPKDNDNHMKAFRYIENSLRDTGVDVIPFEEKQKVIDFAVDL